MSQCLTGQFLAETPADNLLIQGILMGSWDGGIKEDEKEGGRSGKSRVTMEEVSGTDRMVMWRILNCSMIMNSVVRMIQLIPPTNRCRDLWDGCFCGFCHLTLRHCLGLR